MDNETNVPVNAEGNQLNEIIPDGKVKTADGKIIDRANAAFWLAKHPNNENIEVSATGVLYYRMPNGSLKRLTPKVMK